MSRAANRYAVKNRSVSRVGARSHPMGCSVRFKHPADVAQFSLDLEAEVQQLKDRPPKETTEKEKKTKKEKMDPVVQALSDEKLGGVAGRCTTCNLFADECPGHFAHLKLVAPVYHPMLLDLLLKLLKASCVQCHGFRADPQVVTAYMKQVALCARGRFTEAALLTPLIEGLARARSSIMGPPTGGGDQQSPKKPKKAPKKIKIDADAMAEDGAAPTHMAPSWGDPTFWETQIQAVFDSVVAPNRQHTAVSPQRSLNSLQLTQWQAIQTSLWNCLGASGNCWRCGAPAASYRLRKMEFWRKLKGGCWQRLPPTATLEHVQQLWRTEEVVVRQLFPSLGDSSQHHASPLQAWQAFFISCLPVMPPRFRKTSELDGRVTLHSHTRAIHALHHINSQLTNHQHMTGPDLSEAQVLRLNYNMQMFLAAMYDSSLLPNRLERLEDFKGIRQLLEKKEGLFRNNLMSSRVNNACRSVISPDPSLETHDLLMPVRFARKITFPEALAPFNLEKLTALVRKGTSEYPGAVRVVWDSNNPSKTTLELDRLTPEKREELVARLAVSAGTPGVVVHRHVMTGDWALFNRQPSLHRGSMLAHRIRVISNARTFRFHYVNCKGYNADFDGDEMNVHVPQTLMAQAEARCLADADRHYTMPTSGKPVRGLIQDVVSMGVMLTKRDSFFNYEAYTTFLYTALHPYLEKHALPLEAFLLPPAVLRPRPLWSGKQVVSSVLIYLSRLYNATHLFHFEGANLVADGLWSPVQSWPGTTPTTTTTSTTPLLPDPDLQEGRLVVRHGHLLIGVLDGKQVGAQAYSLVHALQELHGSKAAALALASLSRLMGRALHTFAFTCSIADLCLRPEVEEERARLLAQGNCSPEGAELERDAIAAVGKASTAVNRLFPGGMVRPFPSNMLSVMTLVGAKGSQTNASQMAIHLGQQSFGGLRVHNMVTGRSLPCFTATDQRGSAKAWVRGRFLTGISPSDYYIHSIAGRDGLIDTAIKTASSGYLQRCLIKGLEGLVAHYDHTVRDSDKVVVQFRYGEDALDPTKAAYLTRFNFFAANYKLLRCKYGELTDADVARPEPSPKFTEALESFLATTRLVRDRPKAEQREKFREKDAQIQTVRADWLRRAMRLRYARSCVEAGEPVGFIAAQSIGEPSTQMTLNTFHHAGASAEHVTQGIPRLRQLLMAGSVPNPIVRVPIASPAYHHRVRSLVRQRLLTCTLAHLLDPVKGVHCHTTHGHPTKTHAVTLYVSPAALEQFGVPQEVLDAALHKMEQTLTRELKKLAALGVKNIETLAASDANAAPQATGGGGTSAGDDTGAEAGALSTGETRLKDRTATALRGDEKKKKRDREMKGEEPSEGNDDEKEDDDDEDNSDGDEDEEKEVSEDESGSEAKGSDGEPGSDSDSDTSDDSMNDGETTQKKSESKAKKGKSKESEGNSKTTKDNKDKGKAKAKPKAEAKRARKKAGSGGDDTLVEVNDGEWIEGGPAPAYHLQVQVGAAVRCLFPALLRRLLHQGKVQNDHGVLSASIVKDPSDDTKSALMIAGGELPKLMALLAHDMDCFDFHRLYSSDVHAMNATFGIESGYRVFRADIQGVFDSHNIGVDPRHISLIADYCLLPGRWRAFNRTGAVAHTQGMLHKMSFETSTRFLIQAAVQGAREPLAHPSARLMLGLTPNVGCGATFEVL